MADVQDPIHATTTGINSPEDTEELDEGEQALLERGAEDEPEGGAAPASPAPEPEPKPDDEEDGDEPEAAKNGREKPKSKQTVPAYKLVQERDRRRQLAGRVDELSRQLSALTQRLQAPQEQAQAKPQAEPDPEPDRATEGELAYTQWQVRQLNRRLEAAERGSGQIQQMTQRDRARATLDSIEREFLAQHSDYYDRVNWMIERRGRELELLGVTDPQLRGRQIVAEIGNIAQGALRSGRNPAETAYKLAEIWGYQPKTAGTAVASNPAAAQVRKLQRAQEASSSLQTATPRPAATAISYKDLADMDDEDYERSVDAAGGDLQRMLRQA